MMNEKILIVEDSLEYQLFLKGILQNDFSIYFSNNLLQAVDVAHQIMPDLFLIDIGLKSESGFDLIVELKKNPHLSHAPILFLSAREGLVDKITGFSLGADDYLLKTMDPLEILARIKTALKRAKKLQISTETLEKCGIRVEFTTHRAFIYENGTPNELSLTPTEFKLLGHFLKNDGYVLSRQNILDQIWGNKLNVTDRTIDTHVHALRRKLGSRSRHIESVLGTGYRFISHSI